MFSETENRPDSVVGPDGVMLTHDDLPSPETRRWVARRKAAVVAAVTGGMISPEEACDRWDLSDEELESWCEATARHGVNALRTTALQRYRSTRS